MGLRADWTAIKTRAKGFNNGKPIKFRKDLGLGKALDTYEAAEKAYNRKKSDLGPEWAKLADTWVAAAKKVTNLAVTYQQELERMTDTNHQAKRVVDSFLTMHVMGRTTEVSKEGERLAKLRDKHRKK
jgi:hypothetical protein